MAKRIVIKIGSSSLTRANGLIDEARIARFAREIAQLHRKGAEVLLVSSGAIAAGRGELGWSHRHTAMGEKQAAAAVGQVRLMERYRRDFKRHGIIVAQILLTREDFENRSRAQFAHAALETLLKIRVLPIVNENDIVAVDEIRVGDNDTLAARVAVGIKADCLVLLTDVDGLMTHPPHHQEAKLIPHVKKIDRRIESLAQGAGTERGTGGMITKIRAGKLAMRHGITMIIANASKPSRLSGLLSKKPFLGTVFSPRPFK